MSKAFARIERVLICLVGIGLLFKLMVWHGGDTLLIICGALLSLLYFFCGYLQSPKPFGPLPGISAALRVSSGVAFSAAVIGLLFRIMFWQGGHYMLWVGTLGSLAATAIAFATRQEHPSVAAVAQRSLIIAALSLIMIFTPSPVLFGFVHRNDLMLVEKFTAQYNNPRDSTLRADYDAYRQQKFQKHAQ